MSPQRVAHRGVLAAATLALVAGGCSGDESTASDPTDAVTIAPASTTTAPTTAVPPTTAVSTTSTGPVVDASWCDPAADVRAASDGFAGVSTDPDELREVVSDLVAALGAAADAAPDEVLDEVAVVRDGADQLQRALEATEYDILTADLSEFSLLASDLEAANAVIREFNVENCGFDEDVDEGDEGDEGDVDGQADDGFDFGAGTFRDQFLAQLAAAGFTAAEADCIFAEIDFGDPESYSSEAAIVEIFVTCGIDLARIGELQLVGEG